MLHPGTSPKLLLFHRRGKALSSCRAGSTRTCARNKTWGRWTPWRHGHTLEASVLPHDGAFYSARPARHVRLVWHLPLIPSLSVALIRLLIAAHLHSSSYVKTVFIHIFHITHREREPYRRLAPRPRILPTHLQYHTALHTPQSSMSSRLDARLIARVSEASYNIHIRPSRCQSSAHTHERLPLFLHVCHRA